LWWKTRRAGFPIENLLSYHHPLFPPPLRNGLAFYNLAQGFSFLFFLQTLLIKMAAAAIVQTIAEATLSASPRADASNALGQGLANGLVSQIVDRMNIWTTLLTLLALAVVWDQCKYTLLHVFFGEEGVQMVLITLSVEYWLTLCARAIDRYIVQKGSIVGPAMKIPFIGPFLESVNPRFDKYAAKWASGELSCVSVFHK
jgi:hypothetical protein